MNKIGQNLLGQAIVFIGLFLIGGTIGYFSLPEFMGRFFISGLVFAALGIGVGSFVLHIGGR